jgi:hypothetical protein
MPVAFNAQKYKEQVFLTSGIFTVPPGVTTLRVLIVGGGGGGGNDIGGGGGGGGVIFLPSYGPVAEGQQIAVTVGAGGLGAAAGINNNTDKANAGTNGGNSLFGSAGTAFGGGYGGGGGGVKSAPDVAAAAGGCGGGASGYVLSVSFSGGATINSQGFAGGSCLSGSGYGGGGGGGAGNWGGTYPMSSKGGDGYYNPALGGVAGSYYWGGGGGGSGYSMAGGDGGNGGGGGGACGITLGGLGFNSGIGGGGGTINTVMNTPGGDAGANTGGGGGGGSYMEASNRGGNGGSGIVIVQWADPLGIPWTNWSGANVTQGGLLSGVDAGSRLLELRDKLQWLQANKAQGAKLTTNAVGVNIPNNAAISLPNVTTAMFTVGAVVNDVIYSDLRTADATLQTEIRNGVPAAPVVNQLDVIKAADVNALYNDVITLASADVGFPATPWHHNTNTHANHGSHSSHFSHASSSDERIKKNIEGLGSALEIISKLRPVEYEWKDDENNDRKHAGFIAQEIEAAFPEGWVVENKDGIKQIIHGPLEFVSILCKAIQEQQVLLDQIKEKLDL